jgi:hypothetical protein
MERNPDQSFEKSLPGSLISNIGRTIFKGMRIVGEAVNAIIGPLNVTAPKPVSDLEARTIDSKAIRGDWEKVMGGK